MEQFTKILTSNFTSNALVTAFVVVGIVCWVAAWLSTHVFRGKIHSSAIAIAAGLLLASAEMLTAAGRAAKKGSPTSRFLAVLR